jgi:hypothetical protein
MRPEAPSFSSRCQFVMNKANSDASPERLSGLVGGDRNPLGVWRSAFSVPGDRGDVGVPGVSWREDVITETGATVLVVANR